MHRIVSTNYLLTKMGIKENENCSFCKLETETLKHLFWECTYTQTFRREFNLFCLFFFTSKSIRLSCDWNDKSILFGSLSSDNVFNLVLLEAKYFIFKQKFEETSPSFDAFRKVMKSYYNL